MNPYTLSAIMIVCITIITIVYIVSRSAQKATNAATDVITTSGDAAARVASEMTQGAVEAVKSSGKTAEKIVERTADVVQPVSNAVANVVNSIADRIKDKHEELQSLRTENDNLRTEIEQVKSQKVEIGNIERELKLSFYEVPFSGYHIHTKRTDMEKEKFGPDWQLEYFGIYSFSYKKRLGVDLEELRFARDRQSNTIRVSGLGKSKTLGTNCLSIDRNHTEVRKHNFKNPEKPVRGEILMINNHEDPMVIFESDDLAIRLKDTEEKIQYKAIEAKLNSDECIRLIDQSVEHLTISFLKLCFTSSGHGVEKIDEEIIDGMSFRELVQELNSEVNEKLRIKTKSLELVNKQMIETNSEIAALLGQVKNI